MNTKIKMNIKQQLIKMVENEIFSKLNKLGFTKEKLIEMELYKDCKDEAVLIGLSIESQKDYLSLADSFRIMESGIEDFIKVNFSDYADEEVDYVGVLLIHNAFYNK